MRNSIEFAVDDKNYYCVKYTIEFGGKLFLKIAKIIGEPFAIFISSLGKDKEGNKSLDTELGENAIAMVARSLVQNVDVDETFRLIRELIETLDVYVEGGSRRKTSLNVDFDGSLAHLIKVIKEVVRFQYSDFFGNLAAVMSLPTTVTAKTPRSQIKAK